MEGSVVGLTSSVGSASGVGSATGGGAGVAEAAGTIGAPELSGPVPKATPAGIGSRGWLPDMVPMASRIAATRAMRFQEATRDGSGMGGIVGISEFRDFARQLAMHKRRIPRANGVVADEAAVLHDVPRPH